MSADATVTVVGSTNLDTTLRVPHMPVAGETVISNGREHSPGGKGANQAAAAAAAGARVRFIAAIGDDELAPLATENLVRLGVDLSGLERIATAPTGTAILLVAEDAENMIVVDSGANRELDADHVTRNLAQGRTRVILTQLETSLNIAEVCAHHADAPWRILNPAPMLREPGLPRILPSFNVLVPNRTELAQLVDRPVPGTLDEVVDCVRDLGFAGAVVVTLGAEGAVVFDSREADPVHIPPPSVSAVDTTGAGDVFCGVFASELAQHDDLHRSARAAVVASARSTEHSGAQVTLTSSQEHR